MADMLTIHEAAAELRIHVETLRRWIRAGRLRAVKVGVKILVPRSEVERILSEGTAPITLAGGRTLERSRLDTLND